MFKPVAVIPCYNHPQTIGLMVHAVRMHGLHVVVVDDGSASDCAEVLDQLARQLPDDMTLVRLPVNQGKGGAMMAGLRQAFAMGYTHALQIDADGQHDVGDLPRFLSWAKTHPQAVICGQPIYDASVPKGRLYGRYLTHVWVWINTLSLSIRDSMCGYRVYPLQSVIDVLDSAALGRRMDFDPEILVRLCWQGLPICSVPTKVSYPLDGVSHFKMLQDNVLISRMHARLFVGMLWRAPRLLWRKVCR